MLQAAGVSAVQGHWRPLPSLYIHTAWKRVRVATLSPADSKDTEGQSPGPAGQRSPLDGGTGAVLWFQVEIVPGVETSTMRQLCPSVLVKQGHKVNGFVFTKRQ